MKRNRLSYFNKIFLSYVVTIILPVLIISFLYYLYAAVEKKNEIQKLAEGDLESFYAQTRMVVDNIDNLALQLAMNHDLNAKLMNPFIYDIYDFSVLKEQLKNQISTSPLIHSIYVYFKLNDKVLTTGEGFYNRSEFYDKGLLDRIKERGAGPNDYEVRTLQSSGSAPGTEVISFNRPLPVTNKDTLGELVLNVRKDVFFGMLERISGSQWNGITIIHADSGKVLYSSGSATLLDGIEIKEPSGSEVVKGSGGDRFITYMKSRFNSWIFVKSVPYAVYQERMNDVRHAIIRTAALVFAAGLLLSYCLSLFMYSPWKRMIRENEEIKRAIDRTKPIVKHRLIYDMLNNYITDPQQIREDLEQAGIHFPYGHFTVLLAAPLYNGPEEGADHELKLLAFSIIENALSKRYHLAGTLLDHGQFGFILNWKQPELDDAARGDLKQYLHEIHGLLQHHCSVSLQFTVGRCDASPGVIHRSYSEVKRVMNCKALYNKSDVVFVQEMEDDQRLEYPLAVQKELVHHIMATDVSQASDTVNEFFKSYVQTSSYSRERLLEMILMLLSGIINELYQEGYDASVSTNLLELNHCPNNEELEKFIRSYVCELIGRLEQQKREGSTYSLYVAKTIEYIETNYRNNISVADMAEYLGLSVSYVSRVFKAETGKPPLEYLSRYRIMRSKELLEAESRHSLLEISQLVGYRDAHSFIRFFKKYEGVTPGDYRKRLLEKKAPVSESIQQQGG